MLSVDVLAVFGPTGSGKSVVAESLADVLGTDVVSADAMQAYRGLPILTNQPERPTGLVGIWPLSHEGSVGEYERLAHDAIDGLVETRGRAIVAGGTGLYLRAALAELELPPPPSPGTRERWEAAYDADPGAAFDDLARADPAVATLVHPNDRRRVVRGLELAEAGSSLVPPVDRLWAGNTRRPTLVAGLEVSPAALRARIERRTTEMFERGVVDEVRRALAGPLSRTAEKALGLRELAALDPAEAHDAIVRRTVRYAAYQRKWMRRIPGIALVDADRPPEEVANAVLDLARAR
jgi:tRNA dimethylallyltransferase